MAYNVRLSPSGRSFSCESHETLLDAALRNGINLNYGCRSGRCGSCMGRVLQGQVKYARDYEALHEGDKLAGSALYCSAMPLSDLEIVSTEIDVTQVFKPKRMPCKVMRLEKLCRDVMRMDLRLPQHLRVQFLAGQYLDIFQADTGQRRSFSIANAPHDDLVIQLHIRHVSGGEFTDYIFSRLQINDILRIEMPLGTFFLRETSKRPVILMGGGTGFAPLKGILEHAFYINTKRPLHLFWGVRSKRDLYLADLPGTWCKQHPQFQFTPVLSDPSSEDHWQGATGFVHQQVLDTYSDLSAFDLYMSGPPVMIHAARKLFLEHGLPVERMYSDAFEYNAHPDIM